MITFRCERCAGLVQAPDNKAGLHVTCTHCQQVSVCPRSSVVLPLRSGATLKKVGNPGFLATLGVIGVFCLIWVIWAASAAAATF